MKKNIIFNTYILNCNENDKCILRVEKNRNDTEIYLKNMKNEIFFDFHIHIVNALQTISSNLKKKSLFEFAL